MSYSLGSMVFPDRKLVNTGHSRQIFGLYSDKAHHATIDLSLNYYKHGAGDENRTRNQQLGRLSLN